jgi:HEPN domain-containing protein
MNPLTLEWIEKAEGDYTTARREMRARNSPNYDAVCFHAQQMAEKYLKAVLQENRLAIPRTHSLIDLLALISKLDSSFLLIQTDLNILEGYAVQFRYPGHSATKLEAKEAFKATEVVRKFIKNKFGII